ncbi:hypothetical protein ALC56_02607, partial [Trachymyrmex septentrionalis]
LCSHMQVDWYTGYEQFVKRNLTLLPHQQAAQQQDEQCQQLAQPQQTVIMTSMFDQQIKSEPMGFYSVASSRSDGSNSLVNLTTYECNLCGRTFVRDSYLIRHQNRVHRDMTQSTNHNPPTPQSSGAGTPGTGFESPVCDLRYSEGPSSLDGLAGAKGTGIAAEIANSSSATQSLPQHQSPQQVVCPTSASSPFTLNSPISHTEHTSTPQSVYQTTGSSDSLESPNSQLYSHLSSPLDPTSESQHQLHRGIPPPGLHPALYLYAQYSNTSPANTSYSEYMQRNN